MMYFLFYFLFQTKFSKTYSDHAEDLKHKEIFLRNKQFIEEHNKKYETGAVSYKVGLNQFSDWVCILFFWLYISNSILKSKVQYHFA